MLALGSTLVLQVLAVATNHEVHAALAASMVLVLRDDGFLALTQSSDVVVKSGSVQRSHREGGKSQGGEDEEGAHGVCRLVGWTMEGA